MVQVVINSLVLSQMSGHFGKQCLGHFYWYHISFPSWLLVSNFSAFGLNIHSMFDHSGFWYSANSNLQMPTANPFNCWFIVPATLSFLILIFVCALSTFSKTPILQEKCQGNNEKHFINTWIFFLIINGKCRALKKQGKTWCYAVYSNACFSSALTESHYKETIN